MNYPPKSLSKKNTIEKASVVYKTLADAFKYYKQSIDKLKDRVDQIDLSEQIFIDNFLNSYDTFLSDLANTIGNLLLTRKDVIGDDGSYIIKPVDTELGEYNTEIWYSHNTKCSDCTERRFPPRVVCRYDNFSLVPIKEYNVLVGYEFLIGKNSGKINTSSDILNNIFNLLSSNTQKVNELIKYLNNVTLIASYLQDYCLSNARIIDDYLDNFNRLYLCC